MTAKRINFITKAMTSFVMAFFLLGVFFSSPAFSNNSISITQEPLVKAIGAYARATPAKISVIYARLQNLSDHDLRLIGIKTPVSPRTELHVIINDNGILKMREEKNGFLIPANNSFDLYPNGPHIMLFDLIHPLKEGDSFNVTLIFENNKTQEITVNTRPIRAQPDWDD